MTGDAAWPAPVGRQAELDHLTAFARRAAGGRGVAVLVEGEPGIGKSTVLDAIAAACSQFGMRVMRGAAEDVEQRLPFAAVRNCLGIGSDSPDPATTQIAKMLRGEGALGQSASAANHEFAVTEAVLDQVDQWSAAGPVALLLDDVQWADPASAVVLHRIGRDIDQQRLLMVLCGTSAVQSDAQAGLIRGLSTRGLQELTLAPLPEAAVVTLAQDVLGATPGPGLRSILASAGGNPMYVTELLAALQREGTIAVAGEVAEVSRDVAAVAPDWLPRSLVEVVMRRLDFLPRKNREMLQTAAVLSPTIDVTELAAVLDESVGSLSQTVFHAMEAGLLAERDNRLAFRHDIIRLALAEHLPATLRTALHLRAGQVLAAAGAPVERVAEQLVAGTALDRTTLDWLARSADTLLERAPGTAVSLLRRAAAAADGEQLQALRPQLVRALLWDGDPAEAELAARAALAADHPQVHEGQLRWLLAQACYQQGRLADTVAVADEAAGAPVTTGELGRLRGLAAICLFYSEQFPAGEIAAAQAIEAGQASGDRHATGLGYLAEAALKFAYGDIEDALALNDRAMSMFGAGIQPDLQADPVTMRGYCLLELDRFAEADETLAVAVRQNQQSGGIYLALAHSLRARMRLIDGRWDDALAEIQAGLDGPDPLGQAPGLHGLAALIAIYRGVYDPASYAMPAPDDSIGWRKYGYIVRWAQALLAEAHSGPQVALDLLYPVWETAWGLDNRRVMYWVCPILARLAAVAGDGKRARELARTTAALASAQPTRGLVATAQLCRGLLDEDVPALFAAAESFHQAGWPLYEGQAYENAAAILGGRGVVAEARKALEAAIALYAELDAGWSIARAEARLRPFGVRRGVHGPRKRPKFGWDALTDTERKVTRHVVEGLSNPQIATQMFLSRRTVQSHVSSILTKLNVSSRLELAVAASRDGSV